ncbi:MAG TPA: hypothetical protein VMR70_02680 [Flavisolibacter sp.]|nr:hypothetical protein [Flavisolibacter sp.]
MFRQKSPGNIIVLFLFGLLVKLPLFLYPKQVTATQFDEDFYHWLLGVLQFQGSNGLVHSLLSFFLLYVQALMVNYLVNEYRLLPKQNYLPAMAYLLLTSLLPEWNYLSSPLVSSTFIIWLFILLLRLYNAAVARGPIFNIGLLLGLSSYFYFPSASFLLCIILGLIILKPFRLNEVVLFLIGCLTPYYFMAAWLFLNDQLSFNNFFPNVAVRVPEVKSTIWLAGSILLLAIPFLAGGFFVQAHLHKMLIQVRKSWTIVLLYLLLAFFIPFVNTNSSFSNWILLVAPFACFHASTYFYANKKWLSNALFFLTIGYILYLQYGTRLWIG